MVGDCDLLRYLQGLVGFFLDCWKLLASPPSLGAGDLPTLPIVSRSVEEQLRETEITKKDVLNENKSKDKTQLKSTDIVMYFNPLGYGCGQNRLS